MKSGNKKLKKDKILMSVSLAVMVISLVPVVYLTGFNHSTGDDLGYGRFVHAYICGRGGFSSLWDALAATLDLYYYGWQGTWFSITLFALQPGVLSEKLYILVNPCIILLWFGSTYYCTYHIMVRRMKICAASIQCALTTLFLLLTYEFIPSTASSLFWYNGIAHYMIPFSMCQILFVWLLKYEEGIMFDRRLSEKGMILRFAGITAGMTLLGGSSYQNAVLIFMICFWVIIYCLISSGSKRILILLIPMVTEGIGLLVSALSPGNSVRGGSDFSLSFVRLVQAAALSYVQEVRDIYGYVIQNRVLLAGMIAFIVLICILLPEKEKADDNAVVRHPFILIAVLWTTSSMIQAPVVYAGVEVSGGSYNIAYQMILISMAGTAMIIRGSSLTEKLSISSRIKTIILILLTAVCMILVFTGRSMIEKTTTYRSYVYIISGQAHDFRRQMRDQDHILNSGERNVTITPVNWDQGPLMHMPVLDDPDSFTNYVTREFYDLDSVRVAD